MLFFNIYSSGLRNLKSELYKYTQMAFFIKMIGK